MILSYMGKRNSEWVMGWSAVAGLVSLLGTGLYYLALTLRAEWIILAVFNLAINYCGSTIRLR